MEVLRDTAVAHCRFAVVTLCIIFSISCTSAEQKSIDKMTKFVDKVEACATEYSTDQWTVVEAQYENIRAELDAKAVNMTPEQLHAVSVLEGRFAAVTARNYKSRLKKGAKSLTDHLSGFVEGFTSDSDVQDILENLGVGSEDINDLKAIMDTVDIGSIVRQLTE